ncbi:MAG: flagellar basal body-associated FliL family protein [Oscillospiraceae bacterium]|nr:flagellar basal body-associated FliL family protein [Oscillospiraceae bacterium]
MKNKKLIIILVVVIVVAAAAAVFVVPKFMGEKEEVIEEFYYPISDYFVVNVKDGNGMLFKTTVVLVHTDEDMAEVIKANEYAVRDTLLFLFRSLDKQDIQDQGIQERLRQEIPAMLNELLGVDNFTSVLFGDFVMQ